MRLSLVLAGLLGSLLAGAPAHAQGSYTGPNLTGGQGTSQGSSPSPYQTLNLQSGPLYGTNVHGTNPSCGGQIEAQWIWTASSPPGPVPQQVIVKQYSSATWASSTATGQCDDALKDSPVTTPPAQPGGDTNSVSSGTHYSVVPADANGNLEVYCTPTASVATGSCGVYYMASASPVFITLSGTKPDSSGNPNILVGQQCTGTVNGIPAALQPYATYKWSVSGTTFESWGVVSDPNNQSHTVKVDAIPATNPTQWYWNDLANATETVKCTVTVTPPASMGNTFSFTVSAPKPVSVQVPGWFGYETGGYMQVNTNAPKFNGAIAFYAGPSSGQAGGMNWTANVMSSALFASGTIELVQVVTPNASYVNYTGVGVPGRTYNDPENGMFGLDTSYPYAWAATGSYQPPYNPVAYMTNDNPAIGLSSSFASVAMKHQFTDYIMFQPPGSSEWVPLGTASWGTNGSATVPTTDNWGDYVKQNGSDAAGTVIPTAQTPFTQGNTFPSWARVNVFPNTGTWN